VAELNDQSVKVYRQVFQGTNAVGEFLVAALLVLVTMDLLPLGFQYNTLRCEATKTRSTLSFLSTRAPDAEVHQSQSSISSRAP